MVGDSIGVGIATAAGLKNRARISFSLRRNDLAATLAQVPKTALVIFSAGLNDVGDPIEQLGASVDKVLAAAAKSGRRIIWVGPPCVFNKWAERVRALDQHLQKRLAGTGIHYVSLNDDWICRRENRAPDGVHFHHAGYLYLWEKIRRDAPAAAQVRVAKCEPRGSRDRASRNSGECAKR